MFDPMVMVKEEDCERIAFAFFDSQFFTWQKFSIGQKFLGCRYKKNCSILPESSVKPLQQFTAITNSLEW
ncbi:hypothetical protein CFP56_036227 [Quercus suber]|uniref:Uncharacterized protein n=1 Tax=Quercus suber TaxID=58331 RepID=A0AAW0J7F9_QUESU